MMLQLIADDSDYEVSVDIKVLNWVILLH